MHRHLSSQLIRALATDALLGHELDEHADLAAGVNVSAERRVRRRLVTDETADCNVLFDRGDHLRDFLTDGKTVGVARPLLVEKVIDRFRLARGDHVCHAAREVQERVGAADEVSLAIDLDEHAGVAVNMRDDRPLGGDAARFLTRGGEALLAKDLRRLVHVAVRLGQRVLHVHHAGARALAQVLDHRA